MNAQPILKRELIKATVAASRRKSLRNRHGNSLIEVVVSTLLVSLVLYTAMTVSATVAATHEQGLTESVLANEAYQLLEELRGLNYQEPSIADDTEYTNGSDDGELDRDDWDDVDDADGWTTNELTRRSGDALPSGLTVKATIEVDWVDPDTLQVEARDTGLKRITVTTASAGASALSQTAIGFYAEPCMNRDLWNGGIELKIQTKTALEEQGIVSPRNRLTFPTEIEL